VTTAKAIKISSLSVRKGSTVVWRQTTLTVIGEPPLRVVSEFNYDAKGDAVATPFANIFLNTGEALPLPKFRPASVHIESTEQPIP